MTKVAITGGCGFIGSHLARKLLSLGVDVTVVDDLSTGGRKNLPNGVKFIEGSILDPAVLAVAFMHTDCVFHFAAVSSVPKCNEDTEAALRVNVTGTLLVLTAARLANVNKVVFASSSAVYGGSNRMWQSERDKLSPKSIYGITKVGGEQMCDVFSRSCSLQTACLRLFNVIGEDDRIETGRAVPTFIDMVTSGVQPVVFGDGEQTRDYVFIDDVVNAFVLAAKKLSGIYNVGSGVSTSTNKLLSCIIDAVGRSGSAIPKHVSCREGDVEHVCADISKIKLVGWLPMWTLEASIVQIIGGANNDR